MLRKILFTFIMLALAAHHTRAQGLCGVQARLQALGYYTGEIDCDSGPRTRAALRRFQADRGLYIDGTAGEDTLRALYGLPGVQEPREEPVEPQEQATPYVAMPDRTEGPKCLDEVVEVRGPIGIEALGFAQRAAITVWRSQVGAKYGNQYVEWKNATDIKVDCDPACSKCTVRAECTVSARPCRD